eukprot:SAG31_NODE_5350_length_2593_cov_1.862871_5_plen_25_part_01
MGLCLRSQAVNEPQCLPATHEGRKL